MKNPVLFVTGIDTNIGKTYATAFLARKFMETGEKVITQKMIQTGCSGNSEDIEKHRELLGQPFLQEDEERLTAPIIYSYPCSPHMAARIDGKKTDLSVIERATQKLIERGYDRVILEGAGGLMVPLTEDCLTVDYIQQKDYPVALVTNGRLGSINHTVLSLEVCRNRNIEVEYVIYNKYPACDRLICEDTVKYLTGYLSKYHPNAILLIMDELV
ncbi:dethiobiotin synthase [Porphyromonas macacae]|uniref:ATP-dependent dethiobiotin synthetase BioD n=1 Tax=Porphyromonas macacae TaxID=28115 RepID=A0A379DJG7_9PORP|nr:dethiobiotin synthase [Porphyromonas macacae]SUB78302.1 ATP-dependent dethiobiotin synthetase BioD [Porphyromonas macacae]